MTHAVNLKLSLDDILVSLCDTQCLYTKCTVFDSTPCLTCRDNPNRPYFECRDRISMALHPCLKCERYTSLKNLSNSCRLCLWVYGMKRVFPYFKPI